MSQSPVPFLILLFFIILLAGCVTVERNPSFNERPPFADRDRGSNK